VSDSKRVELLQDVSGPPPMVFNNCYLYHGDENVFLTVDDLLRFASQAANGMVRNQFLLLCTYIYFYLCRFDTYDNVIWTARFTRGQTLVSNGIIF